MLRRSTRIKTLVESKGNGTGKAGASAKPKPAKRRRTTKAAQVQVVPKPNPARHISSLRGKLKQLTEIPLELLLEVFSHLNPGDLLHLTWSCTTLREMLMRKSSMQLWKRARDNVGLPDCHPDLNEAQFAKLIFNHRCYYCQCVNARTILWEIGTRVCKKCLSDPNKFNTHTARFAIPEDIIPTVEIPRHNNAVYGYCCRYANRLDDYYLTLDDKAKAGWIQAKRNELPSRQLHVQKCEDWMDDWYDHVEAEKKKIQLRRCDVIEEKLYELGWGSELEKMREDDYTILDDPFVKLAKDLTDESWNNNKSGMIDLMKRIKEKRMAREYRELQRARRGILLDLYFKFTASQPIDAIIPGAADIVFMSEFKALIDLPGGKTVIANDFTTLLKDLPRLIQDWRDAADKRLIALINDTESSFQVTEKVLSLASTLFRCRACCRLIGYPRVLIHACCTSTGDAVVYNERRAIFSDGYTRLIARGLVHAPARNTVLDKHRAVYNKLGCQPWDISFISFDDGASKNAAFLLCQLNLSADADTKATLQNPNFFVECLKCGNHGERAVMTWDTAINHPVGCSSFLRQTQLSHEDQAAVKARIAEKERYCQHSKTHFHWICLICRKRFNWDDLVSHVTGQHRNGTYSSLIESVDYSPDVDHHVEVRSDVFMIPKDIQNLVKDSGQSEKSKAATQ